MNHGSRGFSCPGLAQTGSPPPQNQRTRNPILKAPPQPLYLCGPTASGKSRHALTLAKELNGEIVNADALQLYRGIETITASPSEEDRNLVPHHLYGIADPSDTFDAALYRRVALPLLEDISSRGKLPIVVGGSGLYLKFLTHEPDDLPPANSHLRKELEALSLDEMVRRLELIDPPEANRIDRSNPRYVQRALEISLMSGRPVSEQRTSFKVSTGPLHGILISWEPGALEARIRERTALMLEDGAAEQLDSLTEPGPAVSRAIGVPQLKRLLKGEIDRKTCEEEIVIATRQYAKRQRSWFRRETWLTPVPGNSSAKQIISAAHNLLQGGPS